MAVNTVAELDTAYAAEQDLIAQRRKQGYYETGAEDLAAQKTSWMNYLTDKYRITQAFAEKKAIINYYGNILIGTYSRTRDEYYSKKIDANEFNTLNINMMEEFESKLISAGVLKEKTDTTFKQGVIDSLKDKEILVKDDLLPVTSEEFSILCDTQMPIAVTYIQRFKSRG